MNVKRYHSSSQNILKKFGQFNFCRVLTRNVYVTKPIFPISSKVVFTQYLFDCLWMTENRKKQRSTHPFTVNEHKIIGRVAQEISTTAISYGL